jgi:toxin ParE1/3/4
VSYRLSPLAEQDLDEIWLRVAVEASQETASRLVDAIVQRFAMLARHPAAGRLRPDLAADVRSFPVEKHIVYYREEDGFVKIVRVFHGSRDQVAAWRESAEDDERKD